MLKANRQPAEGKVVNAHAMLVSFCLGGAALALWLLTRFLTAGPHRPVSIVLAILATALALSVAGELIAPVVELGHYGLAVALLVVVLPALTGAFWVSGCAL